MWSITNTANIIYLEEFLYIHILKFIWFVEPSIVYSDSMSWFFRCHIVENQNKAWFSHKKFMLALLFLKYCKYITYLPYHFKKYAAYANAPIYGLNCLIKVWKLIIFIYTLYTVPFITNIHSFVSHKQTWSQVCPIFYTFLLELTTHFKHIFESLLRLIFVVVVLDFTSIIITTSL